MRLSTQLANSCNKTLNKKKIISQNNAKKAQGTMEYLVIVAIVVVIALVVVSLLVGQTGNVGTVNEQSSKLYWSSQSLAVTDSLTDDNGTLILTIKNNTGDFVTLDSVQTGTITSYPDSFTLGSGETKSIYINRINAATTNIPLILTYTSINGITKIQGGNTNLITSKIATINPTSSVILLVQNDCFDWNGNATQHTICTCDDLNTIDYNLTTRGWTYILQNNLDFRNCTSAYTTGQGWNPIGNTTAYFNGKFKGNNKTITGLYINRPDQNYIGLFGYINSASGKDINNLGMIDSNITGFWYVGGISGTNGTINDSYNTGNIKGYQYVGGIIGHYGSINNSYNSGNINGTIYAGGISGYYGTIKNSYNTGLVTGSNYIGGINGGSGTVNNSYNAGTVNGVYQVGGIVAQYGIIKNCYNTGTISGTSNYIGGINGLYATITNSYNTGRVTGLNYVGGISGALNTLYSVKNSFSTSTIIGSNARGVIGYIPGGTVTNLYWYDSNASDNATACYHNGDANCTYLNDTNYTLLYNPNIDVYDGNIPYWNDGNWVWSEITYPTLSWQ